MKLPKNLLNLWFVVAILSSLLAGQQPASQSAVVVPRLVNYSGKATDARGDVVAGMTGLTFSIYKDQFEGAPLWMETQSVTTDAKGSFVVQLGATKSDGLPLDLFTSGEARWLAVRVNGGEEQPRVMLLSVPYALKAGDAATLGGMPLSAFVLAVSSGGGGAGANTASSDSLSAASPISSSVTTTGGTANTLPLFTTATNVQSSAITQLGTGAKAQIGVNTTAPTATLDIHGGAAVRGTLVLPATGLATAAAGKPSEPINMTVSTFNSGSSTSVGQTFQLKTEPANNNTANPGATLNLLFGHGANPPTETGFRIGQKGIVSFSAGQTFPGTGTITGVVAGTGLTGGGNSGSIKLSLDTSNIPQLNAANTFTGNQTVSGNLSATGAVSGTVFQIGGSLFAFGSSDSGNAFLGFAGNSTTTGRYNTASGLTALASNTTGYGNTASGIVALVSNTTGSYNTADGDQTLYSNTTGNFNTANGTLALYSNTMGSDNTASGRNALYSNVAGNYNTADGANALYFNTGIDNTASGYEALFSNTSGNDNTAVGYEALHNDIPTLPGDGSYNTAIGSEALYANTNGVGNVGVGNNALLSLTTGAGNVGIGSNALSGIQTSAYNTCIGFSCGVADNTIYSTAIGAYAYAGQSDSVILGRYKTFVGINTSTPTNVLTIARLTGHAIADGWDTYSSRRWKTNIHTLPNALAKVEQLRGVTYDLKDSGKHEIGVIAEEVGAVVPELVTYEENGKDARGVDYSRLTALLIEATKQQQREVRQQRNALRAQSAAIRELKTQLRATRQSLQRVQSQVEARPVPLHAGGEINPGSKK
jgi:hypothetical protein